MYYDLHNHTNFTDDATLDISDMLTFYNRSDLGLGISEHFDIGINSKKIFDTDAYFSFYEKYRKDILLGIEIGLTNTGLDENKSIAANPGFDYVIGSVHTINDVGIHSVYKTQTNLKDFHESYFLFLIQMIQKNDFFHILGHIDYIFRLGWGNWFDVWFHDYPDYYDTIFKLLIEREIALEVNTVRLHEPIGFRGVESLFNRYKELGGRYVTIGTDSHHIYEMGRNILNAIIFIERIGLTPVTFKQGKMEVSKGGKF